MNPAAPVVDSTIGRRHQKRPGADLKRVKSGRKNPNRDRPRANRSAQTQILTLRRQIGARELKSTSAQPVRRISAISRGELSRSQERRS